MKRLARFRRIRRGWWAFLGLTSLFVLSLFLELLVNRRPLFISYDGRWACPAAADWVNGLPLLGGVPDFQKRSDFGQAGGSEVDYRRFARTAADPGLLGAEIAAKEGELAELSRGLAAAPPPGQSADRIELQDYADLRGSLDEVRTELKELRLSRTAFQDGRARILLPLYPYSPDEHLLSLPGRPPHPPSREHPLGTDDAGKDVLAQLVYGFRVAMAFGLTVVAFSFLLGILAGAVMGYFGGWTDILLQRVVEIGASVPFLFTIMVIASVAQPGFFQLCLLLIVLHGWLGITHYVRGEFYREKAKDYVQAAVAIGASDLSIMLRHILPNALVPVVTLAPFAVGGTIGLLVSLDYLGLGLPVGTPSWGALLDQGVRHVRSHPRLILIPSAALALTLLAVALIGEAVREAFDPKPFSRLR
ncbi:MAG: hypothetical protein A2X36_08365 [Elusimicrobia bacterium GWA2_69_24]|nr:MAG: hypothetical protein A2X36_08365 [Elusimicrobia bacterium GWA2_69_24]HBL15380.1 hypothetical protein [Elusimicrobiota bacterium]